MGHIKSQREAKPSHIYGEVFFVIITFVFKCNSIPMKEIKKRMNSYLIKVGKSKDNQCYYDCSSISYTTIQASNTVGKDT